MGLNFFFNNTNDLAVAIASIGRTTGVIACAMKVQGVRIFKTDRIDYLYGKVKEKKNDNADNNIDIYNIAFLCVAIVSKYAE